jgi:hypothetical protein
VREENIPLVAIGKLDRKGIEEEGSTRQRSGVGLSAGGSPPAEPLVGECRGVVVDAEVVEFDARWDDLVDAVEDVVVELDVGAGEEIVEVSGSALADEHRGDGRVGTREGHCQVRKRQAGLGGQCRHWPGTLEPRFMTTSGTRSLDERQAA